MSKCIRLIVPVIVNLLMAIALSVTADLLHGGLNTRTLLMIPIGFAVGMLLSFLIPFGKIGEALCRVIHVTQSGLASALLSGLFPAIINTAVIGAVMTAINAPIAAFVQAYCSVIPILLAVAYPVGLLAQLFALAVAGTVRKVKKERNEK